MLKRFVTRLSAAPALGFFVLASAGAMAAPRIKVSENKRFLVREDGTPFFYLGDTAWELFHRLDREQAERYLRDRASKGYTVIQAVVLAELDGLGTPNPYGHVPLADRDPTKPNEDYFKHVDWVVEKANALGLVIGMLPTWGDKWNKKWGKGPEIFTVANAEAYGKWLGQRYKAADLIWIVGGDRPCETEAHKSINRAMAKGVRAGDEGTHLITFHPMGGATSAEHFHGDDWLDFNMRQNGHVTEWNGRYDKTRVDYDRTPIKPVLDGEPVYEDHPVSFKADDLGHSIASDVRRPLYWNLFSGAFGHTYGHHSVWQMWTPDRDPINNPLMPWSDAIAQPGAGQMQHGRWLMLSRPFLTRVPDDSVIVTDRVKSSVPGAGRYRYVATRDTDGTYAMVYAPAGRPFSVRMDAIKGKKVKAWWFDPRTGKATAAGTHDAQGEKQFAPPSPGEHMDWVLVLDDAAKRYPPPGSRARAAKMKP
jgi:hypothetical protein